MYLGNDHFCSSVFLNLNSNPHFLGGIDVNYQFQAELKLAFKTYTLGIQSPKLRMVMEPKYDLRFVSVIGHPNRSSSEAMTVDA